MSIEILIDGNLFASDAPDASFILPRGREPKTDVAVALGLALGAVGMPNNLDGVTGLADSRMLTIVKNGTFHQSMIRDEQYIQRSVINIALNGEQTDRLGIGLPSGGRIAGSALLQPKDPTGKLIPVIEPTEIVTQQSKKKTTTVEVDIFDQNMNIADSLARLCQSLFDHAIELALVNELGYLEFLATGYSDNTNVVDGSVSEPWFVYQRSLDFRAVWMSFAYRLPVTAELTSQQQTLLEQVGTGPTVETTLGPED